MVKLNMLFRSWDNKHRNNRKRQERIKLDETKPFPTRFGVNCKTRNTLSAALESLKSRLKRNRWKTKNTNKRNKQVEEDQSVEELVVVM